MRRRRLGVAHGNMTNVNLRHGRKVPPRYDPASLRVADDYQSMNCLNYDDGALTPIVKRLLYRVELMTLTEICYLPGPVSNKELCCHL